MTICNDDSRGINSANLKAPSFFLPNFNAQTMPSYYPTYYLLLLRPLGLTCGLATPVLIPWDYRRTSALLPKSAQV